MCKIKVFFGLALLVMLFYSCEKEEQFDDVSKSENFTNENFTMVIDSSLGFKVGVRYNTLCFPTSNDALTAMRELPKMSSSERRNWEKSIGFTSFQTIVEDIKFEIQKDEEGKNLKNILDEAKAYITFNPSDSLLIKPRVYGNYSYITNSLGYFANDLYVNKVMDGKLYSAFITHLPAVEAKYQENIQKTKIEGLDKFEVQVLDLENEESLKSSVLLNNPSDTYIEIALGNHEDEPWTRRATFKIQLMNVYVKNSNNPSYVQTFTNYYFIVYYLNGLNPYSYGYYGYNFGGSLGWQYFIHKYGGINGDDYWKIRVPSVGYFNNNPVAKPPVGDIEMYISEVIQKNYYNWSGYIYYTMSYKIEGRRNSLYSWSERDEEYAYFYNIDADVRITSNSPNGTVITDDNNNFGSCNSAKALQSTGLGECVVYNVIIPNGESTPTARFINVNGVLGYQNYVAANREYYFNCNF